MATLTFTFDTGSVPLSKIVDSICAECGYQPIIRVAGIDTPNPETKTQFARRMIKEIIINMVKNQDLLAARATAEAGVTPITLT